MKFLFVSNYIFSQYVTPFTLNNGGGYSTSMEWNLGESVSVAHFSVSSYNLSTGVLQPESYYIIPVNGYGSLFLNNQISIGPNPTANLLRIKAKFRDGGTFSIKIIDSKSTILFTIKPETIFSTFEKVISLDKYASGIFYMTMHYTSNSKMTEVGVFKIIKL